MKILTLSISQFNTFVKNILDAEEFLSNISVFGEVTNFKISGGNAYFDLKDENAMLSCVKFGAAGLDIKNGDLITVFGKVNYYVKSGRLNFVVARTQTYGLGNLYQKFIQLKTRLESEGYFREDVKKSIPRFSKRIGVVTSETGAVIRDIANVARKKNKFTDIIVYPSKVQGLDAENEIASGIEYFNTRDDIDVIIIARGGGSLEDLAPFNTEKIVKSIYNSYIPVISAVGHETDFTLCDFASDLRVPTPSVAAEVAFFDYKKELTNVFDISDSIYRILKQKLDLTSKNLVSGTECLVKTIELSLSSEKVNLNELNNCIYNSVQGKMEDSRLKLETMMGVLSKLNPMEILKNGYAIINKNNKKITSVNNLSIGDELKILLSDGSVNAVVKDKGD